MKTDLHKASQVSAAELLGITDRQLRRMKDAPRRTDGYYDLCALVRWKIDTIEAEYLAATGDSNGQRSEGLERFRQARAELAELDLQERRGELLPAADVRTATARAAEVCKRVLLAIAPRVAPQVVGARVEDACQLIDGCVRDALDELCLTLKVDEESATQPAA